MAIKKRKPGQENILDSRSTTCIKGILCLHVMLHNLGLDSMTDDRFDVRYVEAVILRFLNREYEPDGTGGLFKIKNCKYDLRDVEIWYQLNWYLDNFV